MSNVPTVEAIKTKKYEIKQSKYHPNVPEIPFRILMTAPSQSGKTNLLIAMLTDMYPVGKVFERVYIYIYILIVVKLRIIGK